MKKMQQQNLMDYQRQQISTQQHLPHHQQHQQLLLQHSQRNLQKQQFYSKESQPSGKLLESLFPNNIQQLKQQQYADQQQEEMPTTIQKVPDSMTSPQTWIEQISTMAKDPMIQLFGIVFILFFLTAILATVNFCIWYFEKRRRRGPVHWRTSPGVDIISTSVRPPGQTPKRSFHIQHALYKTVRRPSAMPP